MAYLGDGEPGEGHTGAGTRGLVRLAVHEGSLRPLRRVLSDLLNGVKEGSQQRWETKSREEMRRQCDF